MPRSRCAVPGVWDQQNEIQQDTGMEKRMPKAAAELVIIEKTHELLVWTLKHIEKFPRSHRYGVGLRLEQRITGVLELLLKAKYSRHRIAELQDVNLELEYLRFQYRTVKDIGCLSIENYGSAARFVNEIGKLLGGWIKQCETGSRTS